MRSVFLVSIGGLAGPLLGFMNQVIELLAEENGRVVRCERVKEIAAGSGQK
jgi:hypothetical protein